MLYTLAGAVAFLSGIAWWAYPLVVAAIKVKKAIDRAWWVNRLCDLIEASDRDKPEVAKAARDLVSSLVDAHEEA
jgi:hypothetical protein